MRILVTGATGFLGQHLVPRLIEDGHKVCVLLREAYGMGHPLPSPLAKVRKQIEAVYADLRNFKLTSRAVQEAGPTCIVHLAAAGVTDPYLAVDAALRHNVRGTLHLLRACFENSMATEQLIVARTSGEQEPSNVYAASKAASWSFCGMYARRMKWPIHGAIIFQAYGPGQAGKNLIPAAFRAARQGRDFPMTSGNQKRDWIYVEDVIRGLGATLGATLPPGTSVELGTGRLTSVRNVVESIYTLVGRGGRPNPGALPDRPGEADVQMARAARTDSLIGWKAAYPLGEGLRHYYETTTT